MRFYFIIFIFIPTLVFSQQKANTFNLLFTAGVSPAQVHGDSYSGFNKIGAIGGIGVETVFSKKLSMIASFLFIQKGARKNQNIENNDPTYYFLNLNYIEFPILVAYKYKKFLIDVGLAAGYLINYTEEFEAGKFTGLDPFEKFEYSVKVGLGYCITPKWFVNIRSSNSFITIRPNLNKQTIYYNNILARTFNKGYYNNILEFTVSYRIIPKKKS